MIGKIARNNGLVVVLIHPNIVGDKLEFERKLIADWRDRAWIGSVADFGDWWVARDQAEADVVWKDGQPLLTAVAGGAIRGLTIRLPKLARGDVTMDLRAGERRTVPIG